MIHILTVNWTNKEGSTVEIIRCIEERLQDRCRFTHCFQVGEKKRDSDYIVASWNVTRMYYFLARVVGIKYGLAKIPSRKLIKYIDKCNPDVVHIHCPNFYNIDLFMLFGYLKSSKIPTVITNHAEFYYTGNCAHALDCTLYKNGCIGCKRQFDAVHPYLVNKTSLEWKKMKKSFENADFFVMTVVSEWQKKRIKSSPITKHLPAVLIENGVDIDVFKIMDCEIPIEKEDYKHIAVHVTSNFSLRQDSMKGGYYLVELAKQIPEMVFLVLGNWNPKEALLLPDNVKLIGHVDKVELAKYYNIADVTVLTSKKETFGMACAESLCCGTPVAAFEAGGTETIAIRDWSRFVPFADVERLKRCVIDLWDLKKTKTKQIASDAQERYAEQRMTNMYYELYKDMVRSSKNMLRKWEGFEQ